MNVRFTAWLSEGERDALQRVADANNTSANYMVRMALRQFLGLSVGSSRLLHVTPDTPADKREVQSA